MIKWVFFDVGNVIVNDDPWMAEIIDNIYKAILQDGYSITAEEIMAQREDYIINKHDGKWWRTLAKKYIGQGGWLELVKVLNKKIEHNYLKYNIPIPGIDTVIEKLSLDYRLGLAANQSIHCRNALEEIDILKYFDIVGISEEMKIEKPSCEFFTNLLEQAGCSASEAVMIGDRIDNDITPAKKVGMRTIRVRIEFENKGYEPKTDFEKLYFQSMARTSFSMNEPTSKENKPDITVSLIEEIYNAVKRIEDN